MPTNTRPTDAAPAPPPAAADITNAIEAAARRKKSLPSPAPLEIQILDALEGSVVVAATAVHAAHAHEGVVSKHQLPRAS